LAADSGLPDVDDDLAGTPCNDEHWWAETSVSGTDNGCWQFNTSETQFNQRSSADFGDRLCIGVGYEACSAAPPGEP